MVNFNSFGARTTLQSLVKICHFDPCFLVNFWRIQEINFSSEHQFRPTFSNPILPNISSNKVSDDPLAKLAGGFEDVIIEDMEKPS